MYWRTVKTDRMSVMRWVLGNSFPMKSMPRMAVPSARADPIIMVVSWDWADGIIGRTSHLSSVLIRAPERVIRSRMVGGSVVFSPVGMPPPRKN